MNGCKVTKFEQTPVNEGKIQPQITFYIIQVLLVTYRSPPYLHLCGGVAPLKIVNFE